jgi:hypothetical protein
VKIMSNNSSLAMSLAIPDRWHPNSCTYITSCNWPLIRNASLLYACKSHSSLCRYYSHATHSSPCALYISSVTCCECMYSCWLTDICVTCLRDVIHEGTTNSPDAFCVPSALKWQSHSSHHWSSGLYRVP